MKLLHIPCNSERSQVKHQLELLNADMKYINQKLILFNQRYLMPKSKKFNKYESRKYNVNQCTCTMYEVYHVGCLLKLDKQMKNIDK